MECGDVAVSNKDVPEEEIVHPLKPVIRKATPQDMKTLEENKKKGLNNSQEAQDFLEKLYKYRTKICLDPLKHKGLEDTRKLVPGQNIVILLKLKNGDKDYVSRKYLPEFKKYLGL